MSKETNEKRKREGRCIRCGKPLIDRTYFTCEPCRKREQEVIKSSREYYQRIGICPYCHKQRLYNGEKMCIECKAKQYAWMATSGKPPDKEKIRKRRKNLRQKREKEGLCIRCGIRVPQEGRKQCSICLAKDRERHRIRSTLAEYRKEHGLCMYCDQKALPGKKLCQTHYDMRCKQLAKVRPKGNQYWKQQNDLIFKSGGKDGTAKRNG